MSTVLGVVGYGIGKTPRVKVQCATCGRVYVTATWPHQVRRTRWCAACRESAKCDKCGRFGK